MIQKFCSSVIYPIPPCFDSNDQFDHLSISGYLNHLQKNCAKVFLTTAGTSRYNFLSDREFIVFNGNKCIHGNKLNDTGKTRVSLDFRIIPIYQL